MLSSLHRPHDLRGAKDKAYHMSRTVSAMASTQCILNSVQSIYSMASRSRGFSKCCTVSIVQNLYELIMLTTSFENQLWYSKSRLLEHVLWSTFVVFSSLDGFVRYRRLVSIASRAIRDESQVR